MPGNETIPRDGIPLRHIVKPLICIFRIPELCIHVHQQILRHQVPCRPEFTHMGMHMHTQIFARQPCTQLDQERERELANQSRHTTDPNRQTNNEDTQKLHIHGHILPPLITQCTHSPLQSNSPGTQSSSRSTAPETWDSRLVGISNRTKRDNRQQNDFLKSRAKLRGASPARGASPMGDCRRSSSGLCRTSGVAMPIFKKRGNGDPGDEASTFPLEAIVVARGQSRLGFRKRDSTREMMDKRKMKEIDDDENDGGG
ncbi:hypothetical protein EUGRSUZ_A00268 [Eucalyptus grandis]|uniref:Uncharacterized protein n=2 Tax=Eucalyptus grandis TaxID=71139 RepID=A0ACC3LYE7_EUCGR|nr:hypothetical protein EUGRSUZ_A00268 [Eucalyptus grandis]